MDRLTSGQQDYTLGVSILAQALATLTAEVSAAALDIRALNENDITHIPIPYNTKVIKDITPVEIADGDTEIFDFTADDWGEGFDFYPKWLIMFFSRTGSGSFLGNHGEFIEAALSEVEDTLITPQGYWGWNAWSSCVNNESWMVDTKDVYGDKIAAANILRVIVKNSSGCNLLAYIFIVGYPINS